MAAKVNKNKKMSTKVGIAHMEEADDFSYFVRCVIIDNIAMTDPCRRLEHENLTSL